MIFSYKLLTNLIIFPARPAWFLFKQMNYAQPHRPACTDRQHTMSRLARSNPVKVG